MQPNGHIRNGKGAIAGIIYWQGKQEYLEYLFCLAQISHGSTWDQRSSEMPASNALSHGDRLIHTIISVFKHIKEHNRTSYEES